MIRTRAIAATMAAAAIGVGSTGAGVPAFAATSHWTPKKCENWLKTFKRAHPHPSKALVKQGNGLLKAHGCTQRV